MWSHNSVRGVPCRCDYASRNETGAPKADGLSRRAASTRTAHGGIHRSRSRRRQLGGRTRASNAATPRVVAAPASSARPLRPGSGSFSGVKAPLATFATRSTSSGAWLTNPRGIAGHRQQPRRGHRSPASQPASRRSKALVVRRRSAKYSPWRHRGVIGRGTMGAY